MSTELCRYVSHKDHQAHKEKYLVAFVGNISVDTTLSPGNNEIFY
jgi:hypothetical protein